IFNDPVPIDKPQLQAVRMALEILTVSTEPPSFSIARLTPIWPLPTRVTKYRISFELIIVMPRGGASHAALANSPSYYLEMQPVWANRRHAASGLQTKRQLFLRTERATIFG